MAARKKRRSSGTGSIFRDKYGYFNAQVFVGYTLTGRPRYARKRSKVESEVVAWLHAQTVNQASGVTIAPERLTVAQFLGRWLIEAERSARYGTHKGYAQMCHDHIIPRIGRVLMTRLTRLQVQAIIDAMADAGKARNTIRNVRACLLAATADIEKEYPQAYAAVRATKLPKATQRPPAIHALTPEQARLFLAAVESHRLKALYWVLIILGLRKGEALGLHLADLDLDTQTLSVRGAAQYQKGRGIVYVPAKTAASAAPLPIPHILIPVLREHLAMLEEERAYHRWQECGLLFPSEIGTFISGRNLYRHFTGVLAAQGLPAIRVHDLRHTTATLLISLSVHPRVIMEILRHTQISTTMNLYGHTIPEINRDAINALGELVMPETLEMPRKKDA
jgi:integrase